MEIDKKIQQAIEQTKVLRSPAQNLATFGSTNVYYYLITELMDKVNIVREGRVIAAKPKIVTPSYLINLEGFSGQARRFIELMETQNPYAPGIFYAYKNEPREMNVVSEPLEQIVDAINQQIDNQRDPLRAIISGFEELWDVSLIKFTYELTSRSFHKNIAEFQQYGLLKVDEQGVPKHTREQIEELFEKVKDEPQYASELVAELKRWGLFAEYQDRFLSLFRK
ncbi:MAG TPA: hypothetical protein DCX22_01110 [Dehalococcoidia bacterium]|nr:hypothetical protein [Dehalococcoidia bacterium]